MGRHQFAIDPAFAGRRLEQQQRKGLTEKTNLPSYWLFSRNLDQKDLLWIR